MISYKSMLSVLTLTTLFATSAQGAGTPYTPESLVDDSYTSFTEQQPQLAEARTARFQDDLQIDEQTLEIVLPIEQDHRMRVNAVFLADPATTSVTTPRQRRGSVRQIERETIDRLREHLSKAEIRRWRRHYRMSSLGGSVGGRNSAPSAQKSNRQSNSQSWHHQNVDYGSKYYQRAAEPQTLNCD